MVRYYLVKGRVQGVGFRWFVRESGDALGLAGWVRNQRDGTVEVEAEGDAGAIAQLRAALAEGPPGATVQSVDELDPTDAALHRPFTIAR